MAKLIKAQHEVYGIVEVPDTYLAMWPDAYKAVTAEEVAEARVEDRRDELDSKTVDELKADLEGRGLPTDGKKADLVDRLIEA